MDDEIKIQSDSYLKTENENEQLDEAEIKIDPPAETKQYGRTFRAPTPRQLPLPESHTTKKVKFLEPKPKPNQDECEIRKHQYANLCMNTDKDEHTIFLMECMESQRDEETLLTKELELLMTSANI